MPIVPVLRRRARAARRLALALLPLAIASCSDPAAVVAPELTEPLNVGALQVRAASGVIGAPTPGGPAALHTVVTLTNRGAWPMVVRYGACPVTVTAHGTAARTGPPAFLYPAAPPFTTRAPCTAQLFETTIAPGATLDLTALADLAALRAAVPAGRWHLRAEVRLETTAGVVPVVLPAGDVTL